MEDAVGRGEVDAVGRDEVDTAGWTHDAASERAAVTRVIWFRMEKS
jgi:hypothetical protein